jgi:hypothetical protein
MIAQSGEFWLRALRDVHDLPARDAVEGLGDRLRTRQCQTTGLYRRDRSAPDVADVASKIELNPDQKTALIDQAIAAFDAERQAIQKFVNR